jgi:hypothetical protein
MGSPKYQVMVQVKFPPKHHVSRRHTGGVVGRVCQSPSQDSNVGAPEYAQGLILAWMQCAINLNEVTEPHIALEV